MTPVTPGQSGWLGAAAVGSIPALALSPFFNVLFLRPWFSCRRFFAYLDTSSPIWTQSESFRRFFHIKFSMPNFQAGPLEAISVIFGHRALIFFRLNVPGKL